MADTKTALTEKKEAVEGSEEKDIHTSSETNGILVEEHLTRLIPLTTTPIKVLPTHTHTYTHTHTHTHTQTK